MNELRELKHKGELDETTLTPAASRTPRLYGLPKIHKLDVPLWPIVSSINSPTYHLAKYVTEVIGPLAGQTSSFVKNSKIRSRMRPSETMKPWSALMSNPCLRTYPWISLKGDSRQTDPRHQPGFPGRAV